MKGIIKFFVLITVLSLVLVLILPSCTSAPATITPPDQNQTPVTSSDTPQDFVTGMAKVLPSIVIIEVSYPQGGLPSQGGATGAAGTGWIVNADGYIVTNDHVIADAQTITVTLADGTKYTSTAVQSNPQQDLAVVKINARNLTVASTSDSSQLQPGQGVAAVGNSLDMGIRITGGLVSRLNTSATYSITSQEDVTLNGLIETDATINPGNSGGVLIDYSGDVVGIVNAGLSGQTTDVEGFGYAIAINDAMPIINKLISQIP